MQITKLKARGIFLDLDGTIVDSTDAYIRAAEIAFHAIGKTAPPRELLLEIPRRMEQNLTFSDIIGADVKGFVRHYLQAYYSVTEAKTRLIPNVAKTLKLLSEKSKLALITMRHAPKEVISKELDYFRISQYFNHVVTALDTSKPKPSPEALIQCARTLDIEICDCLIAGDSVNDVRAGKAAGAVTVAVLSGLFGRNDLAKENPDLILQDLSQLPQFIE